MLYITTRKALRLLMLKYKPYVPKTYAFATPLFT
jgi:hypothetical protein